jgi:hypothetical protein
MMLETMNSYVFLMHKHKIYEENEKNIHYSDKSSYH